MYRIRTCKPFLTNCLANSLLATRTHGIYNGQSKTRTCNVSTSRFYRPLPSPIRHICPCKRRERDSNPHTLVGCRFSRPVLYQLRHHGILYSRLARESWRGICVRYADIFHMQIPAHPRGAYISDGD